MMSYLSCIKKVKGVNQDECRQLAKSYLGCRMDQFVTPQPPKMRWQYLFWEADGSGLVVI